MSCTFLFLIFVMICVNSETIICDGNADCMTPLSCNNTDFCDIICGIVCIVSDILYVYFN